MEEVQDTEPQQCGEAFDDNKNAIIMSEEEYRSTLKQGYDGVPKQKPKEKLRKKVEKDDLFKEKEDACTDRKSVV